MWRTSRLQIKFLMISGPVSLLMMPVAVRCRQWKVKSLKSLVKDVKDDPIKIWIILLFKSESSSKLHPVARWYGFMNRNFANSRPCPTISENLPANWNWIPVSGVLTRLIDESLSCQIDTVDNIDKWKTLELLGPVTRVRQWLYWNSISVHPNVHPNEEQNKKTKTMGWAIKKKQALFRFSMPGASGHGWVVDC